MEISRTVISKFILISTLLSGAFAFGQAASPTPAGTGMTLVGTPSGLSAYDIATSTTTGTTTTTTDPTIYGGYTGLNGARQSGDCNNLIPGQTCNSCDGTGLKICSQTSVYPDLFLTMTIRTSTTIASGARLRWKFSDQQGVQTVDNPSAPALATNTDIPIQIRWSSLCANSGVTGASNLCTASFSKTLHIGIDNDANDSIDDKLVFNIVFRYVDGNSTDQQTIPTPCVGTTAPTTSTQGICDYSVTRGDEKVYILDYAASGNDLATPDGATKYDRVVMFYNVDKSGTGVPDPRTITNKSESVVLSLQNNAPNEPSISDARVRGLTNEYYYCFALANMDKTGIISYYPNASTLDIATTPANKDKICAQPSTVVGLLDDKHCFIATATYGSSMAPEVQTFREFRNKYLLTNKFGQSIVKAYYKFGPEAAEWVSHSSALKAASLGMLWPILMFVKLALKFGMIPAVLVALLATSVLAKLITWGLRRRSALKGAA